MLRDPSRAEVLEARLRAAGATSEELQDQVASALNMLLGLLEGKDLKYPTFDYYGRAWTLAERLTAFKPSRQSPIRLARMHSAGDALLYSMSAFWRNAERHNNSSTDQSRLSLTESDLSAAVYMRGVDPNDEGIRELWDDMNHMVQLAPGIIGVASETAALAVICVEWLLHRSSGAGDDAGKLAATLLGECVAFTAIAVTNATLQETADIQWFRKYLYFQAGGIYGSTVTEDLILAVYRSCGLPERETANEAIESCLLEVFGPSAEPVEGEPARPSIDRLCREALRHEYLHTHLPSTGDAQRNLVSSDFSPMLPATKPDAAIDLLTWHNWLMESGIVTCWWFSSLDETQADSDSLYIDVEQLYCGEVTSMTGLSLDQVFRSAVSVVYKLHRLNDLEWRLVQIKLSRRAGQCGEGLSSFRIGHGLKLESLLGTGIIRDGRVGADLIASWNQRCLASLDDAVHGYWGQCAFTPDIPIVS